MAHKKFGVVKEHDETREPISFDLGAEEGLLCRDEVNGKLLIELVGQVDSAVVSEQSKGILQVFNICVRTDDGENPDDYSGKPFESHRPHELRRLAEEEVTPGIDPTSSLGRLTEVLDDPDTYITVAELAEMVGWLVEQYTKDPTVSASTSSTGTTATNRTSRRKRSAKGGTSTALTPVPAST